MKCENVDVIKVRVLKGYKLFLTFSDGKSGEIDLKDVLSFNGIFEPLKSRDFFETVTVDSDIGTICWDNGADISPGYLYEHLS